MTDGVARCARYAFGPNRLHMCGPDANREVLAYLSEGVADDGLMYLLAKFKTLYPYLETIAHAKRLNVEPCPNITTHSAPGTSSTLQTRSPSR